MALLSCLVLCACDTASPAMWQAETVRTQVEGSAFTLHIKDGMVEAVRTSPEVFPRFDAVARKAAFAAQRQTGCDVAWAEGDPAIVLMGLSCNGLPPPPRPKRRKTIYCDVVDVYTRGDLTDAAVECDLF